MFLHADSSLLHADSLLTARRAVSNYSLEKSIYSLETSDDPQGRTKNSSEKSPSFRRGWGRLPLQKSNNFERFFSDSTLTFLTSQNTFLLPILPTRRIILLCLPLILIRGRQRKIRGRQILTGCASKIPDFKGKVTKKGGSRGSSHISVQI